MNSGGIQGVAGGFWPHARRYSQTLRRHSEHNSKLGKRDKQMPSAIEAPARFGAIG